MSSKIDIKKFILICLGFIIAGIVIYYLISLFVSNDINYVNKTDVKSEIDQVKDLKETEEATINGILTNTKVDMTPVSHIKTPEKVKAIYMSSWVAGSDDFRNSLVKIIDTTELNAVVIDIKDSTGRVSFHTTDEEIKNIGSSENRIKNIRSLTSLLHSKGIYIIGRISVFQDPYITNRNPEWAIKKLSDGKVWKDRKGLSFLDPTNKNVHDYIIKLALYSYNEGFDEINFDYIRYPSDGNMKDINYNLAPGRTRADNIEAFFKHLSQEIKKSGDIPISADLFGLTTEAKDDMGIGQVWEKAIPHFDYVCPMIYPSHYPPGHAGYKNPASYPYEIIDRALIGAISKTKAINENTNKIRPWLQDFDLGATYTADMVQKQFNATYDNDLDSWMLWDPSNKYTPSALKLETIN